LELTAVRIAFEVFRNEPLKVITDSYYAAGILNCLEASFLKEVDNPLLMAELRMLWFLINHRHNDFYAVHICSHTALSEPLAEGNRRAMPLIVPKAFEQAKLSHEFFRQNARSLKRQFQITMDQAKSILTSRPDCQQFAPMPSKDGVNP
ncbi:POK18 protein, partial [Alopecoenas beccarii]|nr:POK18 protein [Alopecoenas beccarii]